VSVHMQLNGRWQQTSVAVAAITAGKSTAPKHNTDLDQQHWSTRWCLLSAPAWCGPNCTCMARRVLTAPHASGSPPVAVGPVCNRSSSMRGSRHRAAGNEVLRSSAPCRANSCNCTMSKIARGKPLRCSEGVKPSASYTPASWHQDTERSCIETAASVTLGCHWAGQAQQTRSATCRHGLCGGMHVCTDNRHPARYVHSTGGSTRSLCRGCSTAGLCRRLPKTTLLMRPSLHPMYG
jgi:hypothetical protein